VIGCVHNDVGWMIEGGGCFQSVCLSVCLLLQQLRCEYVNNGDIVDVHIRRRTDLRLGETVKFQGQTI